MTPQDTAAALKKPIGDLGMQFMADPLTRDAAREQLGLRGRRRCGPADGRAPGFGVHS